jgi:hypothetical protein
MVQAVEAYRGITATEEFKHLEILRARAKHDEVQALNNARKQGEKQGAEIERQKWQDIVTVKDSEIEQLRQELAELRAQN